jgi:dTDP-4-dehydrorhamnose reductase
MSIRRRHPRRLFVTGGAGFLGRHIVNGPASEPWEVVAPSSRSLDLRNAGSVTAVVRDWKPTAIVHTAYRRGDRSSIVDASANVAVAARRSGCRLVHVSTDVVFGGRLEPYTEEDPPSPVHDYGRDKADAERAVAAAYPPAVIVRTSLIYGRTELSGHELAVREVVSGRSEMSFFTDEVRSPVLADDLAAALVELADRRDVTGMLHLGGPDPLTRAELAVMTARRHGWDVTKLRFSTIGQSGLVRPGRIVLDSGLARSLGLGVRGPASWE